LSYRSPAHLKLFKSMKKLVLLAMVATVLTIFNGCQKDELVSQLADEQPQLVVKPDIYVEGDYLVFKNFEVLDSLSKELNNKADETIKDFEAKIGFKSAYSYLRELKNKVEGLSESEIPNFLENVFKRGYFNKESNDFAYPFTIESFATVLNPDGKVQIGKTIYRFEGATQFIKADLSGLDNKKDIVNVEKKVLLDTNMNKLKSGDVTLKEVLIGTTGSLRCKLEFKRDYLPVKDWIIVGGQLEYVTVGYNWRYYHRFYSYNQGWLYKTDRDTYFNWKTQQLQIGGDLIAPNLYYPYLNYFNANPYTERSTVLKAVYTHVVYEGTTFSPGPGTPPTVYNVNISDFWSDYISNIHGSLTYPN
jgi:hypothetical protein